MYQLEPGSEFAGFVIEGIIGTGGMSVLYRARDPQLRRVVALKIMSAVLSEDHDFRRRFAEEARLAAAIDHPNVVPIYGFGQVGESLYIAMRYVPGTDLRKLLRVESSLTPQRISDLLGQVAAALDVVHRQNMVHRDVKPDNVLITPPGPPDQLEYAYLADFGLTRSDTQSRITQAGQIVGTLAYAAPEQLRGEEVDGGADVYSLGCVLYECLVGDRPFRRNNDASVIYAHLHDPPPRVTEVRPDLPDRLDAVIATALAKEPAARFATAGDLLRSFRVAVGLEAGPVTSEISLDAIARAASASVPPVEVWAVADGAAPGNDGVMGGDGTQGHAGEVAGGVRAAGLAGDEVQTVVRHRGTDPTVPLAAATGVGALAAAGAGDDAIGAAAPASGREPGPRSRRSLLLALGAIMALVVFAGVLLATKNRESTGGVNGGTTSTEPLELPGVIVDQDGRVLSTDPDVKLFRTIAVEAATPNVMTISLRVANRSRSKVTVDLTERIPRSLLANGAQVLRLVDATTMSVVTIAPGDTASGMDLPFRATLAAGADAMFEYFVRLDRRVVDADLTTWSDGLPGVHGVAVDVPGTTAPTGVATIPTVPLAPDATPAPAPDPPLTVTTTP